MPIIHELFGKENHYLSNYGCKQRATEEFYARMDGKGTNFKYPQRESIAGGRRMLLPSSDVHAIIPNNK
jgi:hypothetical protein